MFSRFTILVSSSNYHILRSQSSDFLIFVRFLVVRCFAHCKFSHNIVLFSHEFYSVVMTQIILSSWGRGLFSDVFYSWKTPLLPTKSKQFCAVATKTQNQNKYRTDDITSPSIGDFIGGNAKPKPSSTMRLIPSYSHHDLKHKIAVSHSMTRYMVSLPLTEDKLEIETKKIVEYGRVNGY